MLRYQPSLKTERLKLRPFIADDADDVQRLAGERDVADSTLSIPHPYSIGAARTWIAGLPHFFRSETGITYAISLQDGGELVGCVSLDRIDRVHANAKLGYWIGVPFWGSGYGTEACREMVRFGFTELSLNRIYAHQLVRNEASGPVLHALDMVQEGVLRQGVRKWDAFEDVAVYALLRRDWKGA